MQDSVVTAFVCSFAGMLSGKRALRCPCLPLQSFTPFFSCATVAVVVDSHHHPPASHPHPEWTQFLSFSLKISHNSSYQRDPLYYMQSPVYVVVNVKVVCASCKDSGVALAKGS